MNIRLFNLEGNKVTLARAEIGLYKEFNAILRRDRGSEKDADGRKKYHALREFHYIYLVGDNESNLIKKGLTGKELKEHAKLEAGLEDAWKEDDLITAAIEKYKELNFDITKELITELLILFRGTYKRVSNLRKALYTLMDNPVKTRSEIEQLAQMEEKLFDIAAKTPDKIKALQRALKELETLDMSEEDELRGGGLVPESAQPGKAIS
jgi:hypothetical protein